MITDLPAAATAGGKTRTLIAALPALARLHGRTVVAEVAATVLAEEPLRAALAEDLTLLRLVGVRPVVVPDRAAPPGAPAELVRLLGASRGGAAGLAGEPNPAAVRALVDAGVVPVLLGARAAGGPVDGLAEELGEDALVRTVDGRQPHALLAGLLAE
ncbi:hypothetical protein [Kitasatospora brasiliensis]|uniref:hypothetical protein n=1 Tax=Kitasatospora brasiliensis TaxID=3058040 RepID=UPI00292FAF6A|nr:hypothetical protein [Kitasatospora sp. K002]